MSTKKGKNPAIAEEKKLHPAVKAETSAKILVGCTKLRDKKQIQAAQLIVDGGMTDHQIAEKLGIGKGTIAKWKVKPQFVAYLDELKRAFADRFLKEGLAKKENRVAELSSLYLKSKQVIVERASQAQADNQQEANQQVTPAQPIPEATDKKKISLRGVAGADTGMVVMTYKGLGNKLVAEVDVQTVKMMASLLDQISVEVGDKVTKGEVKINDAIGERIERAQARLRRNLLEQGTTIEASSTGAIN